MAIDAATYKNVAIAISQYSLERWTHARLLTGTGMTSGNVDILTSGEGFTGQLRWLQEFDATINQVEVSGSSTDGTVTNMTSEIADYIKCMRSFGADAPRQAGTVTQRDGLQDFADQFVNAQAKNESKAIESVIKGVIGAEAAVGAGIVQFSTDADAASTGAFVDLNAAGEFGAAATGATDERGLVGTSAGGKGVENLFKAVGMFWKDYEPDYMYMITNPQLLADLRSKNLVDDTTVTEGNIEFSTILNGKFRLIMSRVGLGDYSAGSNVNTRSTKTTVLVAPGAISFVPIMAEIPVEFDRDASAYGGGGKVEVWYRYGFIVHPNGYDWAGATNAFPSDATLATAGSWSRKAKALNLGILPIFHA